ncbi:hypothetical protein P152DRAFT_256590 [Eremomyces bilateralis CBS 781.70]|uniref:Uncharacterized protein n=1 Tax=Eremomyces bilateralis CBS 781.70 TaxID=1392243 RepID=A0A6G1FQZ3_9PEZI|nr:uncharacterized protein P152DRAFT_256590 [Eremomyces bilateralis CBS 781.70]KAF1808082.1 hypothetical protein P152DRAFT_256590 [Eremomyces bilateralis CBS 781.70]
MSSSTNSNHTVTIQNPLKDITNWIDWYEEIKNYAQRIKVWDYVNPTFVESPASEGKEAVKQPIHKDPALPPSPSGNETNPDIQWLWKTFEYEKRAYDLREAELKNLANAITASVSGGMTRYIKGKYLAKDMLQSLHRYAAPQSTKLASYLEEEFNRLKKGKKNRNQSNLDYAND